MIKGEAFRQYDIRGVVGEQLNEESYYLIGKGFGTMLQNKGLKTIVIGGDARHSTRGFMDAFIKGARETGCNITDIGIVATPILYFSIWKLKMDGGAMITASHNPSHYNGCKLNLGMDSVFGEALQDLLKLIQKGDFAQAEGTVVKNDSIADEYMKYISENIHIERPVKVIL